MRKLALSLLAGTALALAVSTVTPAAAQAAPALTAAPVTYRSVTVGDVEVAYREAGPQDAPTVLLLHGFPTGGYMFRDLIPRLADRFHLVAPDLPGFGFTKAPPRGRYAYSFESLARTVEGFTDALGLDRYAIYVFDYGAPVGLRLALARPERITAIITQNGNAYEAGLSDAWNPIRAYWREPGEANREALRSLLTPETTRWQYVTGADPTRVAPEGWALDAALLARPGNDEIQLDLFKDYASNVALYPRFQAFFRERRPPLLAVWGRNDPFFLPAGAEAFRRDIPDAEIHLLDTGHFALETHAAEIAALITGFLDRRIPR
jgi:pimeloyl-ACP methyl ester carboxylesterase